MAKSGKVFIGAELALEYGVTDTNGRQTPSHRAFYGETTTYGDAIVEKRACHPELYQWFPTKLWGRM
jgi:hypothetical protein